MTSNQKPHPDKSNAQQTINSSSKAARQSYETIKLRDTSSDNNDSAALFQKTAAFILVAIGVIWFSFEKDFESLVTFIGAFIAAVGLFRTSRAIQIRQSLILCGIVVIGLGIVFETRSRSQNQQSIVELGRIGIGPTNKAIWSPNGNVLALSTASSVYLYDGISYDEVKRIDTLSESGNISFSPDSQKIITLSRGAITIWSVPDGEHIKTFNYPFGNIRNPIFSPDGTQIAAIGPNNNILVWDMENEKPSKDINFGDNISYFAFYKDNDSLILGFENGGLELWDIRNQKLIQQIADKTIVVRSLLVSETTEIVAVGFGDQFINVWSLKDYQLLKQIDAQSGVVSSLDISSDGKYLVAMSSIYIEIWDLQKAKLLKYLDRKSLIINVDLSPDDNSIVSTSYNEEVVIWKFKENSISRTFPQVDTNGPIAFSNNGKTIASTSFNGGKSKIILWDVYSQKLIKEVDYNDGVILNMTYSASGELYIGDYYEDKVRVWRLGVTLEKLHEFILDKKLDSFFDTKLVFDKNIKTLAFVSKGEKLYVWNISDGSILLSLEFPNDDKLYGIGISNDGELLAFASFHDIKLWIKYENRIVTLRGRQPESLNSNIIFSSNNQFMSIASDMSLYVWNRRSLELIFKVINHYQFINHIAFSPDDLFVASASVDGTIRLTRSSNGESLGEIRGHSGSVTNVQFSPVDDIIAFSSADGTIRLWAWDRRLIASEREAKSP